MSLAADMGYEVLPYGRSMDTFLNLGQRFGLIEQPLMDLVYRGMKNGEYAYNPKQLVLVAGPQGEERAALYRIASGRSPFTLVEGDTFIFSSKAIPGNEAQIAKVMSMLTELGATVIHSRDANIHASGHGVAEDWRILIEKFQPELVIPVHGESLQLARHDTWVKNNFGQINTLLIHNADQVQWTSDGEILLAHGEEPPPVAANFKNREIGHQMLNERRTMIRGVAFISIDTDAFMKDPSAPKKGKANYRRCRVTISTKGVQQLSADEQAHLITEIQNQVQSWPSPGDRTRLVPFIRQYLRQQVGIKPALIIHVNGELLESGWEAITPCEEEE